LRFKGNKTWHLWEEILKSLVGKSEVNIPLEFSRHIWEYNFKLLSKKEEGSHELDSYDSGEGYVAEFCEDSNKPWESIEGGKFFEWLRNYWPFRTGCYMEFFSWLIR
jgi:hypothetical protein